MKSRRLEVPKWSAADRARHKAIRDELAHRPTREALQASGAYEGPIKSGAPFSIKEFQDDICIKWPLDSLGANGDRDYTVAVGSRLKE